MSQTSSSTASGSTISGSTASTGRLRRAGPWALLLALVLATALILALAAAQTGQGRRLDPSNPAPGGGQALAQILNERGVQVTRVTRSAVMQEEARAGATVLVTSSLSLGPQQLSALASTSGPLVLIEPQEPALARLAPSLVLSGSASSHVLEPGCADPAATAAGRALAGGLLYQGRDQGAAPGLSICYPDPDAPGAGSYLVSDGDRRTVTVVGQGDLFTNDQLGAEGNATLALRTLGAGSQVIWYVPDPLENGSGGGDQSLRELIPPVVWWIIAQLGLVTLLVMFWRGRRLGRLVYEPLPVVVSAAETQLGRARLYRQARARGRAGDTLRTAALRRLAHRLAAPQAATPVELVQLVAATIDRPESEVGRVLLGPPPQTDLELIELADRLDDLEHRAAPRGHRIAPPLGPAAPAVPLQDAEAGAGRS